MGKNNKSKNKGIGINDLTDESVPQIIITGEEVE